MLIQLPTGFNLTPLARAQRLNKFNLESYLVDVSDIFYFVLLGGGKGEPGATGGGGGASVFY